MGQNVASQIGAVAVDGTIKNPFRKKIQTGHCGGGTQTCRDASLALGGQRKRQGDLIPVPIWNKPNRENSVLVLGNKRQWPMLREAAGSPHLPPGGIQRHQCPVPEAGAGSLN